MSDPVGDQLVALARRLLANVAAGRSDEADGVLSVPAAHFVDQDRHERELTAIFGRCPLVVALTCDVREPGSFSALTIAGRPLLVARGEDGIVRTFLNVCRHRGARVAGDGFGGARRFTCPYHFWVYDTLGRLAGITDRGAFAGTATEGLVELPTSERHGAVFAVADPDAPLDLDTWLGGMGEALDLLDLGSLHRHREGLVTGSGNWKATADGYVDGYHIGYLHRESIGANAITNRNTYDCFGPHTRIGFATTALEALGALPEPEWTGRHLREAMSLVHFVFPNVSFAGMPGQGIMVSRILPGPSATECLVEQFQYFRRPMTSSADREAADRKRDLFFAVTRDEDFATVRDVTAGAAALGDRSFVYGRNEVANQQLHRWIWRLAGEGDTAGGGLSLR